MYQVSVGKWWYTDADPAIYADKDAAAAAWRAAAEKMPEGQSAWIAKRYPGGYVIPRTIKEFEKLDGKLIQTNYDGYCRGDNHWEK